MFSIYSETTEMTSASMYLQTVAMNERMPQPYCVTTPSTKLTI